MYRTFHINVKKQVIINYSNLDLISKYELLVARVTLQYKLFYNIFTNYCYSQLFIGSHLDPSLISLSKKKKNNITFLFTNNHLAVCKFFFKKNCISSIFLSGRFEQVIKELVKLNLNGKYIILVPTFQSHYQFGPYFLIIVNQVHVIFNL